MRKRVAVHADDLFPRPKDALPARRPQALPLIRAERLASQIFMGDAAIEQRQGHAAIQTMTAIQKIDPRSSSIESRCFIRQSP
jgi:hypothetical protein